MKKATENDKSKERIPFKICKNIAGESIMKVPVKGMILNIPVTHEQKTISSDINNEKDKKIGINLRDIFYNFDDLVERYASKHSGPEADRLYFLETAGFFTSTRKIIEACWEFPVVPTSLIIKWHPITGDHSIPVYVRKPPGNNMYPAGFGRSTAYRWNGDKSSPVYLVMKEPLAGFDIENPAYTEGSYAVPEFMMEKRKYGVISITLPAADDPESGRIIFKRADAPDLEATLNEIRSRPRNADQNEYELQMQAVQDVVSDYPVQLAGLLDVGVMKVTRRVMLDNQRQQEMQQQQQQQ